MKRRDSNARQVMLAFLAGGMFLLAGTIEFAMDLDAHGSMQWADFRMAAIFLFTGTMWIAIGAKWKRNAKRALSAL
jgi:hypothetical protein